VKYTPELRGLYWVAVDREVGVELACWFESETTCEEIGRRTEDDGVGGQFMTNIPLVPVDTPIPRPTGIDALHPRAIRLVINAGNPASDAWKRHRLNPKK
jgi:hypothetical protein